MARSAPAPFAAWKLKAYPLSSRERASCALPSNGYTDRVSGTPASTAKPKVSPFQNMGQLSHGTPRALPSHVLKYGLRTINGRTEGFNDEALAKFTAAAAASKVERNMFLM